jgi:hypothetical protein
VTARPRYYGLRRLNPFLGSLEVVAVPGARGISPNGSRWQVELLSETAVRQPLWADIGPASAERRFFTYGVWSAREGLKRLPVNPILGDQSGHPALESLLAALEAMPGLPFPTTDRLELWLLDRAERLPLALVLALTSAAPPTMPFPPAWRSARPEPAARQADDGPGPPPAEQVERLVNAAAGSPALAQWFLRDASGGGLGLSGFRLDPGLPGRSLPREAFPELLLREDWARAEDREEVAALLAWQAPLLLTLPDLPRSARARLEPLAARRPLTLYRQRRLLPDVLDRPLLEAALVRAVIQKSG